MDPIESNAIRDDMERLHQASAQALRELIEAASRIADDAMRVRAERAREALERARDEAGEATRQQRGDRDAAAAVWDTRLRDRYWFADAPAEEIMQTWLDAQVWADIGDPRGIAAVEAFRLRVTHLGIDPDAVARAIQARDVDAFAHLLNTPEQDPARTDDADRRAAAVGRAEGDGVPAPDRSAPAGRRTRRQAAAGRDRFGPAQLEEMTELVRSSMQPGPLELVLQDPQWPRVAGQLHRAWGKIEAFNRDHPEAPIDLRAMLNGLQWSRPSEELRTPAGWMIWNLHNTTASRGVQLIAQTRPRGNAVRAGRSGTAAGNRSRTSQRPRQPGRDTPDRD